MMNLNCSHKFLFIVFNIYAFYGCATKTESELVKELDAMIGSEITTVIDQWGLPTEMNSITNGTNNYVWLFDEGTHIVEEGAITKSEKIYCKITFIVNIEGDIDFSIYIISPESKNDEIYPLAILLHGFANPGYSTYKDWSETLASRGVAVAFIQYPSDVWPEGHDTYVLHEEGGMSNHPFHVPRTQALYSALDFLTTILPQNVNPDNLLVGGHSLGAGYAFIALEWALNYGWGNSSLFVDLEAPYARPVQEDLQVNLSKIPDRFMAHIAISEDDMSVSDCFGVHHQQKLGHGAILLEIPSDRHGYPRMVASHYLQASETHDSLADWGFYRRVSYQADWLYGIQTNDIQLENTALQNLVESPELTYMGEWSDGKKVKQISVYQDALNSTAFNYCKSWTGP